MRVKRSGRGCLILVVGPDVKSAEGFEYRKRDNFARKIDGIESTFRDYGIAPPRIKAHPFDRVRDTLLLADMNR